MPQHILEEQNHGSTRRTRGITHKYSTEHIVVSLLWQYDIRIFFCQHLYRSPGLPSWLLSAPCIDMAAG